MVQKVRITISFDIIDEFYSGEGHTRLKRLGLYKEDFSDIEVLYNHIPKSGYDCKAEFVKQ